MGSDTLYIIAALVIAIVLHELAHGVVARAFGDKTAQAAGRLTLNPLKHVDRMGTIAVPALLAIGQLAAFGGVMFMYGWAKPVPVTPGALRLNGVPHPRQLMAVVAAAGPVANFLLAVLGGLLLYTKLSPIFLTYFIAINLTLGIFNLPRAADGWRAHRGGGFAAGGCEILGAFREIWDFWRIARPFHPARRLGAGGRAFRPVPGRDEPRAALGGEPSAGLDGA